MSPPILGVIDRTAQTEAQIGAQMSTPSGSRRQILTGACCFLVGLSVAMTFVTLRATSATEERWKMMQVAARGAQSPPADGDRLRKAATPPPLLLQSPSAPPDFVASAFTPEFLQAVADFSIVITWVNGSDPNYMKHREIDCKAFYTSEWGKVPASMCDPHWRLARVRNMGEILFLIRSIETNLPWFQGTIFLVMDDWSEPPAYFEFDKTTRLAKNFGSPTAAIGPTLRLMRHSEFIPKALLPTYSAYAIIPHLHRIPGVKEIFAHIEDDNIVARPLPPTAFVTPFGGPQLYFEPSSISKLWCEKRKKKGIWLASMCRTLNAFIAMHPGLADTESSGGSHGHYLKHAPVVYQKSVLRSIVDDPKVALPGLAKSLRQKFRTGPTVQSDSVYAWHMVARGGTSSDTSLGVIYGFKDEMRLLLLNDRTGEKKLNVELSRFRDPAKVPMFFTINDDGWTLCDIGSQALSLLNEVLPVPSRWEHQQIGDMAKVLMGDMHTHKQCREKGEKKWKNLT